MPPTDASPTLAKNSEFISAHLMQTNLFDLLKPHKTYYQFSEAVQFNFAVHIKSQVFLLSLVAGIFARTGAGNNAG